MHVDLGVEGKKLKTSCANLKPVRRAVCFDFDETLTAAHASERLLKNPTDKIFGGAGRVEMLAELLHDLVSVGVIPTICTFNSAELVEKALSMSVQQRTTGLAGTDLMKYFTLELQNLGEELARLSRLMNHG